MKGASRKRRQEKPQLDTSSKAAPPSRAQFVEIGQTIIRKMFRVEGLEFSEQPLEPVLEWFGCASIEDLYVALGRGFFTARLVFAAAFEQIAKENVVFLLPVRDDKNKYLDYTNEAPPSSPADISQQEGMRDDFNIRVKEAKAETVARLVDLSNPALSKGERLTRARRVLRSFERRRAENPDFPASPEVLKARSIVNKDNYERRKTKAEREAKKLAM
jgi:hypothetical protein